MTVYLAFNEAEGVDDSSNLIANTVCAVSGVATHGFRFDTVPDGSPASKDITFPSAISEGWVHVRAAIGAGAGSRQSGDFFTLKDTAGNDIATLNRFGTTPTPGAGNLNASTVISSQVTLKSSDDGPWDIDIHFKVASEGFVKIYVDNELLVDVSGDTISASGVTSVDTITIGEPSTLATATDADSDPQNISFGQILVSSEPTLGSKVYTLYPTSTSTNDWDSGTVADIDERGVDDTDQAATTTNGDQFTIDTSVSLSTPTLPNKFTAIVQAFRASYDSGAAVTGVTPFLNDTTSTGTYYGTPVSLTTSLVNYRQVLNSDPADASDWTAAKINNYEFGVRADT